MMLTSDLQPILVDPLVTQDSEVITKTGADVSQPILTLLNWSAVAGQAVALDTIVFPDDPTLPSMRTAQICVHAGTAGTVEPDFPDTPGATTHDGTVIWASLGQPNPPETAYDWQPDTNVPLGEIILPRRPLAYESFYQLELPGLQVIPKQSVSVTRGTYIGTGSTGYVCTLSGLFGILGTSAVFTPCGLPDGKTHYICVQSGKTGAQFVIPNFNSTLHAQTTDGTVKWAAIGLADLPIGGTPGDTWGRSYFDTKRGLQSVEYLVSVQRARALMKARAVTLNFTPIDPFGLGVTLTCRKTATVYDNRIAGGYALGKVISVKLACNGNNGQETCQVQLGCCIGKDNDVTTVTGSPTYAVASYVGPDYQQYTGTVVVLGDHSKVGYTPPKIIPNDDGLVFPLDYNQVVLNEAVLSSGNQGSAVGVVLSNMQQIARLQQFGALGGNASNLNYQFYIAQMSQQLGAYTIAVATAANPIWYDAALKPLTGFSFNNNCVVQLTKLTCPRGIDLTGISTP
jgi:hypothetical protein